MSMPQLLSKMVRFFLATVVLQLSTINDNQATRSLVIVLIKLFSYSILAL